MTATNSASTSPWRRVTHDVGTRQAVITVTSSASSPAAAISATAARRTSDASCVDPARSNVPISNVPISDAATAARSPSVPPSASSRHSRACRCSAAAVS